MLFFVYLNDIVFIFATYEKYNNIHERYAHIN